jgi:ABC-2 type transport system permease protein
MYSLVKIELLKMFARGRTYIALGAILCIVFAILLALYIDGENFFQFQTQNLRDSFLFEGHLLNGYLASYIILTALLVHIPFLIALVAGEMVAGESAAGTLRLILIRQASRTEVLSAKFIALMLYSVLMVLLLAASTMILGVLLFGKGDLFVVRDTICVFNSEDTTWRLLSAYAFAIPGMGVVAAIAFMFSVFSDNSITPVILTMVIIIAFMILSAINLSLFKAVKPLFFTTYMNNWRLFFDEVPNTGKLLTSLGVLVLHIFICFGISLWKFRSKDILS